MDTYSMTSYWSQGSALNATSFVMSNGVTLTWLFDEGNVYLTIGDMCQYYCPITMSQCSLSDSLCTYDYLHGATYSGQTKAPSGQLCDEWAWSENLGPIPMSELTLLTQPGAAVPVFQALKQTPYGKFVGWMNTTFQSFTAAQPPPSAWSIPGKEACQMGGNPQCGSFAGLQPGDGAGILAVFAKRGGMRVSGFRQDPVLRWIRNATPAQLMDGMRQYLRNQHSQPSHE